MKTIFHNVFRFILVAIVIITFSYCWWKSHLQFKEGDELTEYLHSISADQVTDIMIYCDSFFSEPLFINGLNSLNSRSLFAKALNELEDYQPNHDGHVEEGSISFTLIDKGDYFLDFWIKSNDEKLVCMHLMKRWGQTGYYNLGGRKSKKFYEWLNYIDFSKLKNSNMSLKHDG